MFTLYIMSRIYAIGASCRWLGYDRMQDAKRVCFGNVFRQCNFVETVWGGYFGQLLTRMNNYN